MITKPYCFVIMPINNPDTEQLWCEVYDPVIRECGFDPDRIDRSDNGSDLVPQILEKIVNAALIVADLTMGRQNCYFELGYAFGRSESETESIIICCREDHYDRSPNYRNDGLQVHSDVRGRSIIWWDNNKLIHFRTELKAKIESRMKQIRAQQAIPEQEAATTMQSNISLETEEKELESKIKRAREGGGVKKDQLKGYMEFFSCLPEYRLDAELQGLTNAARKTEVPTFGWPIGLVFDNEYGPRPYSHDGVEGIKAVYKKDNDERFDYWTLDKNGDYYILATLFEDERKENRIFFDTRTVRTAETYLRTANLYKALGVPSDQEMECKIEYGGLEERVLSATSPMRIMFEDKVCSVPVIQKVYRRQIGEFIQPDSLKEIVFDTIKAITEMCGMWVPSKAKVIDPIVEDFLNGKII